LERKKRLVLIILLTLPVFPTIAALQVRPVLALVPSVDAPVPWTSGTHTILNITVRHDKTVPSGSSHYVDYVEVDIDGTPDIINLDPSQPEDFFVIQYDMGEMIGTPTVKARAHCTVHGLSGYSPSVQVPEFSFFQLLLILAIITIAIALLRSKVYGLKKKTFRNTEGPAIFPNDNKTTRALCQKISGDKNGSF
jgi:hypothetical protein